MPSSGRALVIGGGISAGTPFALDQFLYVTNVTQPTAASFAGLVKGTNAIEAPGTVAARALHNTVIGQGHTINASQQDAVVIGTGNSVQFFGTPTTSCVVIGANITNVGGTDMIAIGGNFNANNSNSCVKIGSGGGMGGVHNDCVAIGQALTLGGSFNGVQIGKSSSSSGGGSGSVIIGNGTSGQVAVTVVGSGCVGNVTNCTVVGQGINIGGGGGTNNILMGGQITGAAALQNAVCIGNGAVATAGQITLGNANLANGGFSSSVLWGGVSLHTSGVVTPPWTIAYRNAQGANIAAGDVTYVAPRATGNAASANIVFQTGAVGVAGSVLQTATSVCRITNAQQFEIMTDNGLTFVNQTSGAGAAVGTLNNAPTAGDPTHWLRVTVGGVNKFIPCW